jgi:hypothetical protein
VGVRDQRICCTAAVGVASASECAIPVVRDRRICLPGTKRPEAGARQNGDAVLHRVLVEHETGMVRGPLPALRGVPDAQ